MEWDRGGGEGLSNTRNPHLTTARRRIGVRIRIRRREYMHLESFRKVSALRPPVSYSRYKI